jgi:hypothetical protein
MPQHSIMAEFSVIDLRLIGGLHPQGVLLPKSFFNRRLRDDQRYQHLRDLDGCGVAEAGTDLADIVELALLAARQAQCTEAAGAALHEADDDERVALNAFDLQPVFAAAGAVGGVGLLLMMPSSSSEQA